MLHSISVEEALNISGTSNKSNVRYLLGRYDDMLDFHEIKYEKTISFRIFFLFFS